MDERRQRFERLVLPHLDAAHNLARWLSRASVDAEDIVQEAMLRAYRAFDGFRGEDAKPWLLAIVRNCHFTAADKKKRHRSEPLPDQGATELPAGEPDPEGIAIGAAEMRRLNEAIATLPTEFREVLILREMEDMSYREIAAATSAPIGTIMSRLARARALLRQNYLGKESA